MIYSGTQLIRFPMDQQNLTVLTGDFINVVIFYKRNCRPFCQAAKIIGLNNEVTVLLRCP